MIVLYIMLNYMTKLPINVFLIFTKIYKNNINKIISIIFIHNILCRYKRHFNYIIDTQCTII